MSERAWHEKLMPDRIRKTCVTVIKTEPDKVLTNYLVEDWPTENGVTPFVKIDGRLFLIRREPTEGFQETENLADSFTEWIRQYEECRRAHIILRFNEEMQLRALSTWEYEEELRVEDIARHHQRTSGRSKEEEEEPKQEKKRGKKSQYDWSKLEGYIEQGLPLRDIAEKVGCSVAAVRHQVKKRNKK